MPRYQQLVLEYQEQLVTILLMYLPAVLYCLQDTDAAGNVPEYQQLVLEYQGPETAGVATADDPPVVLGR